MPKTKWGHIKKHQSLFISHLAHTSFLSKPPDISTRALITPMPISPTLSQSSKLLVQLRPLPCSYSSAQANVYGDYCLTGEVESASVSVFNLIGAYFQLTVPRSLVIKGIKFDSLGV